MDQQQLELLQRFDDSRNAYNIATGLMKKGQPDDAEKLLREAMALYPRELFMDESLDVDATLRESFTLLFSNIRARLDQIERERVIPAIDNATMSTLQEIVERNLRRQLGDRRAPRIFGAASPSDSGDTLADAAPESVSSSVVLSSFESETVAKAAAETADATAATSVPASEFVAADTAPDIILNDIEIAIVEDDETPAKEPATEAQPVEDIVMAALPEEPAPAPEDEQAPAASGAKSDDIDLDSMLSGLETEEPDALTEKKEPAPEFVPAAARPEPEPEAAQPAPEEAVSEPAPEEAPEKESDTVGEDTGAAGLGFTEAVGEAAAAADEITEKRKGFTMALSGLFKKKTAATGDAGEPKKKGLFGRGKKQQPAAEELLEEKAEPIAEEAPAEAMPEETYGGEPDAPPPEASDEAAEAAPEAAPEEAPVAEAGGKKGKKRAKAKKPRTPKAAKGPRKPGKPGKKAAPNRGVRIAVKLIVIAMIHVGVLAAWKGARPMVKFEKMYAAATEVNMPIEPKAGVPEKKGLAEKLRLGEKIQAALWDIKPAKDAELEAFSSAFGQTGTGKGLVGSAATLAASRYAAMKLYDKAFMTAGWAKVAGAVSEPMSEQTYKSYKQAVIDDLKKNPPDTSAARAKFDALSALLQDPAFPSPGSHAGYVKEGNLIGYFVYTMQAKERLDAGDAATAGDALVRLLPQKPSLIEEQKASFESLASRAAGALVAAGNKAMRDESNPAKAAELAEMSLKLKPGYAPAGALLASARRAVK